MEQYVGHGAREVREKGEGRFQVESFSDPLKWSENLDSEVPNVQQMQVRADVSVKALPQRIHKVSFMYA